MRDRVPWRVWGGIWCHGVVEHCGVTSRDVEARDHDAVMHVQGAEAGVYERERRHHHHPHAPHAAQPGALPSSCSDTACPHTLKRGKAGVVFVSG
eukprot:810396-Rhodomonas_salina.3